VNIIAFIAPAVANPLAVYSVVALLVFWAVWSGVRLERRSAKFQNVLDSARRRLERTTDPAAFAQDYEAIRTDLSGRPVIGERWKDFCNSLLVVERPAPRVGATSRIGNWFDLGLLRADPIKLDLRYHAALPNLLVGAGLLFTFLGLTVALYAAGAVVEGQAAQRTAALKTLLDTASFKFITSLIGLALSIAYALWRKRILRRSERSLDRFVAAIEARVPIVTPASLQLDTNEILERQASHLESFSTDLALGIGSALDRVLDQRLGEHIAPLTEAMEKLAARTVDDNHAAISSMLDTFLQRLEGGAGDHLGEVAGTLAALGGSLEGMQAGLSDASSRMAQSAEAMATRMGEGAEAALARITDHLGGLADSLRATADQTRAAGAEASSEMTSRIERAASGFEEAARGVAVTLSAAADGLRERMGKTAEESSERLANQFEGMLTELRSLAESSRRSGQDALAAVAEQVSASAAGFERTAASVAEALEGAAVSTGGAFGKGAEEAVSRIADATEGMRSELQAMLFEFRNNLGQAGNDLREAGAVGAASLKGALDQAGVDVAAAVMGAADRLAEAGKTTASSLERGGESASSSIVGAASGFGQRAQALGVQVTEIARIGGTITASLTEFEKAAREASSPLALAAADLKEASRNARESVEPLMQIGNVITRSIEQIAGATYRLETTGAAATKLMEGMTIASNRFEGVDRELSKVFQELQKGLQAFTQQVTEFVKQTDGNLAKAATQLGSLVKSLQASVEDFVDARERVH
jgi:hypothetical protein